MPPVPAPTWHCRPWKITPMPEALIIDDEPEQLPGLPELVEREGFTTRTAGDLAAARAALDERMPDVVLSDLMLPDGSGLDLLSVLEEDPGKTQMVLITGNATVESAVEALRRGVTDYLTKPIDLPRLKTVLANVARLLDYTSEIGSLRHELRKLGRFGPMIGASRPMQEVYDLIAKVAPTEATVLVTGESGTGKELVAQTIQGLSRRRRGPVLASHCRAGCPHLVESPLLRPAPCSLP